MWCWFLFLATDCESAGSFFTLMSQAAVASVKPVKPHRVSNTRVWHPLTRARERTAGRKWKKNHWSFIHFDHRMSPVLSKLQFNVNIKWTARFWAKMCYFPKINSCILIWTVSNVIFKNYNTIIKLCSAFFFFKLGWPQMVWVQWYMRFFANRQGWHL